MKEICEVCQSTPPTVRVLHHNSERYPGLCMDVCEPCRLKHYVDYSYQRSTDSGEQPNREERK